MDINDLKTDWNRIETNKKSRKELMMMIKIQNHPKLNRIRIRLIIEIVMLVAFLAAYNDIFDGPEKPLWVNVILIFSAVLFILTDAIGYWVLQNPIQESNLRESLTKLHTKIKRLSIFSLIASFLFGLSVVLFFTSTIVFTPLKYLQSAGLLIALMFMLYISYKSWAQRMNQIKQAGMEFEEIADS
jgi:cation transport ATPase